MSLTKAAEVKSMVILFVVQHKRIETDKMLTLVTLAIFDTIFKISRCD